MAPLLPLQLWPQCSFCTHFSPDGCQKVYKDLYFKSYHSLCPYWSSVMRGGEAWV